MPTKLSVFGVIGLFMILNGCAMQPMGPTVTVMPPPNKPFDVFQQEQAQCKQYGSDQVAGQVQAANNQAIAAGVLTTALGAGIGAAAGGGEGAGIGAATGAAVGSGIGATTSSTAQMTIQQQYDAAYMQCMYAKGNQVPGFTPASIAPPPPPAQAAPAPVTRATQQPTASRTLVSAVQTELVRLGYLTGAADGISGPKTRAAIDDYQSDKGMTVDGTASQQLLDSLKSE
jgi:hypothetical protein